MIIGLNGESQFQYLQFKERIAYKQLKTINCFNYFKEWTERHGNLY